jgi:hypothetical protein
VKGRLRPLPSVSATPNHIQAEWTSASAPNNLAMQGTCAQPNK